MKDLLLPGLIIASMGCLWFVVIAQGKEIKAVDRDHTECHKLEGDCLDRDIEILDVIKRYHRQRDTK